MFRRKPHHLLSTSAKVATCALVGSLASNPNSHWYRSLNKPFWQPPKAVFPFVWSVLYSDIAVTTGLALNTLQRRGDKRDARALRRSLNKNLVLNAGWSVGFFGLHQDKAAVPIAGLLAASSADLSKKAGKAGLGYRAALLPYAGWTAFAAALNTAIARKN